ncbi:hypothetical protein [Caballeronia sp. LZ016]|uniref:hypothetical protein n=1 Tax=Caballeronia sp. LZ016 TaxID=3038554 RepID=UPI00286732BD|nr:hypothetical protein [Caballeronia sp. LZ016]MDR5740238.1 hypothetical protein [Caballeronia sp. LZ016]
MLKSQDILVALKLTSLALQSKAKANEKIPVSTWRGWEEQWEEADRQENRWPLASSPTMANCGGRMLIYHRRYG